MKKFCESCKCTKCGNENSTCGYDSVRDLLQKKCLRCGYTWEEFPLDKPEVQVLELEDLKKNYQ